MERNIYADQVVDLGSEVHVEPPIRADWVFPKVSEIISGSDFGQDAVKKAHGVCERARQAITARDVKQLQETTEALTRTLNMFKGVVSKTKTG